MERKPSAGARSRVGKHTMGAGNLIRRLRKRRVSCLTLLLPTLILCILLLVRVGQISFLPFAFLRPSSKPSALRDDSGPLISASTHDEHLATCVLDTAPGAEEAFDPSLKAGPDNVEIVGRKYAKQPRDFEEIWAYTNEHRYYFHPDRESITTVDALGAEYDTFHDDSVRIATRAVDYMERAARKDTVVVRKVSAPTVYTRLHRRYGLQAVVNIVTSVNNTSGSQNKVADKRQASLVRRVVTVSKGFGLSACKVNVVKPGEGVPLHVILPYSKRPKRLGYFLWTFIKYYRKYPTRGDLRLVIAVSKEEHAHVISAVKAHTELVEQSRVTVITVGGDAKGHFSRAVAIREAVSTIPQGQLMFFSDVDMIFSERFASNCRMNTIKGHQVWFPVMYSLYPYGSKVSNGHGFWRRSSYGMVCMYPEDYYAVGGFGGNEEHDFVGWGSEDVLLYNAFRDHRAYAVFRSLEPDLLHLWHSKTCEKNDNYANCMRTVYLTMATQDRLAKLIVEQNVDTSALTAHAKPV